MSDSDFKTYHLEPRSLYDRALIGYDDLHNRAIYSRDLLIPLLIEDALNAVRETNAELEEGEAPVEMSDDPDELYMQALEYYHHNLLNSYFGEAQTPLFVSSELLVDD